VGAEVSGHRGLGAPGADESGHRGHQGGGRREHVDELGGRHGCAVMSASTAPITESQNADSVLVGWIGWLSSSRW